MFWKRKDTYTPPPPKPMVARFTVYMRKCTLTYSEEYNGAHRYNEPEPHVLDGMVRVGNHWINRDEIEYVSVKYEDLPHPSKKLQNGEAR